MNTSTINDAVFRASTRSVESIALLKCQLYCLENDFVVQNNDANGYYNMNNFAEKSWWKSYLVRESFYHMEHLSDENLGRMKNALLVLDDVDVMKDAEHAVRCVRQHIETRKEKEADDAMTYSVVGIEESGAFDVIGNVYTDLKNINTYEDLVTLGNLTLGALIECESESVSNNECSFEESSYGCLYDSHTSGHHRDDLTILHAAYKNYSWSKASMGTLYEDDEPILDDFLAMHIEWFDSKNAGLTLSAFGSLDLESKLRGQKNLNEMSDDEIGGALAEWEDGNLDDHYV